MTDTILYAFVAMVPLFGICIILLFGFKLFLFITNRTSSWKPLNFFYFEYRQIEVSRNADSQRNKKFQNLLSIIIAVIILLLLVGVLFGTRLVKA